MRKLFTVVILMTVVSCFAFCFDSERQNSQVSSSNDEPRVQKAASASFFKAERKYPEAESFVVSEDWKADGYVSGEKDKKILVSSGDTVYLNMGFKKVSIGARVLVFRLGGRVKDFASGDTLGRELTKVGKLQVTNAVAESVCTAKVLVAYDPIEIGDCIVVSKIDAE
jgi:hypothetical protein